MNSRFLLFAPLSISLFGCATETPRQLEPVPLQDFLGQLGEELHNMQANEKKTRTGLYPSELTLTVDVTVKKNDSGKVDVSVSPPAGAPVSGSLSAGKTCRKIKTGRIH